MGTSVGQRLGARAIGFNLPRTMNEEAPFVNGKPG